MFWKSYRTLRLHVLEKFHEIQCNVAALLAASLQPNSPEDAVAKYQKVLAELRRKGGPLDDGTPRDAAFAQDRDQQEG